MCEALKLAKIPEQIVQSIERLIKSWKTELNLPTVNGNILIGDIIYKKGALQGDYLSVILFILSLNPGSYLLNQTQGYKMGSTERSRNLMHLFFVDDLKLYASSLERSKYQLDVITTFSKDIGMTFGEDKCGYIYIERGSIRSHGESIIMNGVTVKELEEGESYRYLGVDENVEYNGKINKERILKEYYRRVKTIWSSELNSRNKTIAHNSFAIPILILTGVY